MFIAHPPFSKRSLFIAICVAFLGTIGSSVTLADVDSLKGTTNTFDAFLSSSGATANSDTLNYGVTDGKAIGWNNSNQFYGNFLFGAKCSTTVAAISAAGHTIDSIRVRLYNYTTSGVNVGLKAFRAPSNWNEGTGNGTASPTNGVSMKYKGTGTAWSGETASGQWAGYATQTDDDFNISSYTDFGIVAGDPVVTMLAFGYYWWNVTDQFTDSFAVGQYEVSILFSDTVHTTTGSHERLGIYASEKTVDSLQPTILFYHSLHVTPDPTWLRVNVTVPAGTVADMPVLINWLTYPDNASECYTIYAVDSTTKLYSVTDSLSGHYTRGWVRHDWAGGTDTVLVRRECNPAYHNPDSVFLLYEDFSSTFSVTQLCASVGEGQRVARDTINHGAAYLDLENNPFKWMYENSNVCSTGNGYVQVLCGGSTTYDSATDPQDSTFGYVYRSQDLITWVNEGMIVVSRSAPHAEDTIRMQDPYLLMDGDTLRMVFEDKRINTVIGSYDVIGQMVSADDGATWLYRGVLVDTSFWDSDEGNAPSSPVLWKHSGFYYLAGEGKNGHYTENTVVKSTEGGAIYMAYGEDIYDLNRFYPDEDGTDFELPAIPYASGYAYACVPDAYWREGSKHYLSAHTQNTGGDSWAVYVWESALNGCEWVVTSSLSDNAKLWGDTSLYYRALADDPQPTLVNGKYYFNSTARATAAGVDTVLTMNWCPMIKWDTTGNPFDLWYWNNSTAGSLGYIGARNGMLTIEMEPLSERASCGIMTQAEFDSNYICDVRYRFDYPADTAPYVNFGFGNDTLGAFDASNKELTNPKDGFAFRFQPLANNTMLGYRQPASGNRVDDGADFAAPTYSANWNWFSFGMTTDTVWAGFDRSLTYTNTGTDVDTLDEANNITIGAGCLQNSLLNGTRVAIDVFQVRKYVKGGFSSQASDTLYAFTAPDLTLPWFNQNPFNQLPYNVKPFAQ